MFYKLDKKTGEWSRGNEVHFPDGSRLGKKNKVKKDDFEWFDNPPQEYLDYVGSIENDIFVVSTPVVARKFVSTTSLTTKKSLWSRIITFIKRIFTKQ